MNPQQLTPESPEPACGSVLMVSSVTGTAYQRFYSDGMYHGATGDVRDFAGLFTNGRGNPQAVFLIHDTAKVDA